MFSELMVKQVKPGYAFENTELMNFSSGLKMSGAVENLPFIYLWNSYHQQIPGVQLIQRGAISILLCQHYSLFHCWKDIWCWKLPRHAATSENDRLHICSLCQKPTCGDTCGDSVS
jgi:hypothetical protein